MTHFLDQGSDRLAMLRVFNQKLIDFSFRMRGDYLIADEVRTRMDKQFERDLRLMKKVSDHNRVANNMYSRSENIGRVSEVFFFCKTDIFSSPFEMMLLSS